MIESLFVALLGVALFLSLLVVGGLIAKFVFGCDWNEPEYYAYRKNHTDEAD